MRHRLHDADAVEYTPLAMPLLDGLPIFTRDSGHGRTVLLAHSAGSTSGQWRGLTEQLVSEHRVLAPDLYGHGRTPVWPGDPIEPERPFGLDHEARLLAAVVELAEGPVDVVGHSYGGAACLQLALRHPHRVRTLTLLEPTLFRILRDAGRMDAWDEVHCAAMPMVELAESGQPAAGAQRFIEYLMGAGAWDALPEQRRAVMTAMMPVTVVRECRAQMLDASIELEGYRSITIPTTLVVGTRSPPAVVAVSEVLASALPSGQLVRLPGAGHMAPMTHPEAVEAVVRGVLG